CSGIDTRHLDWLIRALLHFISQPIGSLFSFISQPIRAFVLSHQAGTHQPIRLFFYPVRWNKSTNQSSSSIPFGGNSSNKGGKKLLCTTRLENGGDLSVISLKFFSLI